MTLSREGRPSGEAYIDMETEDDYKRGLDMNKKYLGSRYSLDNFDFAFIYISFQLYRSVSIENI